MHGYMRFNKGFGWAVGAVSTLVLALAAGPFGCEPGGGSNGGEDGCPQSMVDCGGMCIDPLTDRNHCGAGPDCTLYPGQNCGPGYYCDGTGQCSLACQTGFIVCNNTCVDPLISRSHCGAGPDCALNPGEACGTGEVCNGAGDCV